MSHNAALYRRLFVSPGAYKSLTESGLALLQDGDRSVSSVSVSAETLSVTYALGVRYRLGELRYYRTAATLENVTFYGKQGVDAAFVWEEIPYTDAGDYLVSDLSVLNDRYELVKVVHSVTAGTAEVFEFELFADDGHIKFGSTGAATIYSIDSGTGTLIPEEVTLYNPDSVAHDFFVLPAVEDPDSAGLSLGLTSSGVFQSQYERGLAVPDDFTWASGSFSNTEEGSGGVVLSSGTSGFYYTPVIDVSALAGRRFFWSATLSGSNRIDELGSVDGTYTVGVRFSNEVPTDVGWFSGQLSTDANWSVVSGTLSFEPYANNQIVNPKYLDYFQARIEFSSPSHGETPTLLKVGVEEGLKLTVASRDSASFFVKSTYNDHVPGRQAELLVWNFEARNEEQ